MTHLENGKTLPLGPFKITPYLMDHSAYDSYAVLIEVTENGFSTRAIYASMAERVHCSPVWSPTHRRGWMFS